jgi:hypothetical protein
VETGDYIILLKFVSDYSKVLHATDCWALPRNKGIISGRKGDGWQVAVTHIVGSFWVNATSSYNNAVIGVKYITTILLLLTYEEEGKNVHIKKQRKVQKAIENFMNDERKRKIKHPSSNFIQFSCKCKRQSYPSNRP